MAKRPRTLREVFNAHEAFADSLVAGLDRRVRSISIRAAVRLNAILAQKLDLENGVILRTANNQRVLRSIPRLYAQILDQLGYNAAVDAFALQFPNQLPFISETFEAINTRLRDPLPLPLFARDQAFLSSRVLSIGSVLRSEAGRVAQSAAQGALLTAGAASFASFREALAVRTGRLQPNISALAATVVSTNFRVMNDRAYEFVEKERGLKLKYVYFGPRDKLNRPFCRRTLGKNIPRTRVQIQRLANKSSLKNNFVSAGGFNCRHIWIPAVSERDLVFAG